MKTRLGWAKGVKWTPERRAKIMAGIHARHERIKAAMSDTQQSDPTQPVKVDNRRKPMSDETKHKLSLAMRKSIKKRKTKEQNQVALMETKHPVVESMAQAGNVSSEELRYVAYAVERLECPVTVEVIAAIIDLSVAIHAALRPKKKREAHGSSNV